VLTESTQRYRLMTVFDEEEGDAGSDSSKEFMSGYLEKQGEKNAAFKRRWCVLCPCRQAGRT
jgi:hypothetical protein